MVEQNLGVWWVFASFVCAVALCIETACVLCKIVTGKQVVPTLGATGDILFFFSSDVFYLVSVYFFPVFFFSTN
ncbi:hypothetical protein QBC47DRAFT_390665 [Echria macrotheca]|uniref:Uncharacterized protein n=1 Tax=Echria macrotheca TaxID=438768 RepID=A0AAJ0B7K9_9PEZI|nr:hypothetical protein QBC47DRAFT_390665 [Echria macrotheca]